MISSHSITMISLVISPWWWVRGDYPKKHFRRVNDWNLPRSSQIYPALIIPFYIPFYISSIRWILYRYTNIPKIYPILYISPRYPQDIPNFTRKSAGLGSWDHRSSQRFGDFAGQGYSVTPHGIPKKQYWLVVMLCDLCDLCEVILHIYIYVGGFQICYMV